MTNKEKEAYYQSLNEGIDIMETELFKYKKALEILKDTLQLDVKMETNIWETGKIPTLYCGDKGHLLTKEEYELLEEVMKDE